MAAENQQMAKKIKLMESQNFKDRFLAQTVSGDTNMRFSAIQDVASYCTKNALNWRAPSTTFVQNAWNAVRGDVDIPDEAVIANENTTYIQ